MVALIFLLVIATVFASVLALEGGDPHFERRPAGLLTWIASGNWPAKIGGGLMIVGVGALLRYAAINFDVPKSLKISVGIAAAAALGIASYLLANNPKRRAISLALGGAAFGVAYLTAYSAYALFGYLPNLQGLGLLAITAVAAGVFAVTRSALSLAVLSMVGAFMSPAFAVTDPGATVVYSYYVAISLLTLYMVALRGWRPLIHLSFLFTLAGGGFFAWTADYFSRTNAPQMLPFIAALAAVHVAMPLFERRWQRGFVVESLDTIYLLALPIAAVLTSLAIAPSRIALAHELWWFAAIWSAAAAWLYTQKREGMATHAVIALLMLGLGLAARFRNLPWEIVALAVGVSALVLAARRSSSTRLHSFLIGLVLVLAAIHMASAVAPSVGDRLFLNGRFFERLVGAGLLVIAALTARRLRHALDSLMATVAIGWSAFALGAEVARLDLVSVWLLLHWACAFAAGVLFFTARRFPSSTRFCGPLVFAIGLSAILAGFKTHGTLAWVSAIIAACAMFTIALRPAPEDEEPDVSRLLAAIGAPIMVALWMARFAAGFEAHMEWQFPLAFAAPCALAVLLAGAGAVQRSRRWLNEAADIFAVAFVLILAVATLFDIERAWSAALLELTCIAGMALIASWDNRRISIGAWLLPVLVIGVALVLQANLLRWLGPSGDLTVFSLAKMAWPTLVSLLWASIGAALTIAARRAGSRVQWSAGAVFLVGAAIKLVLLDFGSLGQLANILAVIAAGGVFLLVGWLAPMPPAREAPPKPQPRDPPPVMDRAPAPAPQPAAAMHASRPASAPPRSAGAQPQVQAGGSLEMPESYWTQRGPAARRARDSNDRLAWNIAIVVFVLFMLTRCSPVMREFMRGPFGHNSSTYIEPRGAEQRPEDSYVASVPAAIESPTAVEDQFVVAPPDPGPAPSIDACEAWASLLPASYQVYVVNTFDTPNSPAFRGVLIDAPGDNVVLVLGSTVATRWKFSVMPGSSLAGVWLVGRETAQLEDLPENVAVLEAARVSDECATGGATGGINPQNDRIVSVLHRPVTRDFQSAEQWLQIGSRQLITSATSTASADPGRRNEDSELALRHLLERGAIRRATLREIQTHNAVTSHHFHIAPTSDQFAARNASGELPLRVFIVQAQMDFPAGLTGAHAATFLVPYGTPHPTGDPGRSRVVDLNR